MTDEGRTFSYEEALDTFPSVRDLTETAVRDEMEQRKEELEEATKTIIEAWAEEIASIGCEVKGLWLVDWDSGDGYYCWRYPEASLAFYHSYEDGFKGRVPIN
jgi:hypothetical protein